MVRKFMQKANTENWSYKLRLNQFSDLNGNEFKYYVHGKNGACFKQNQLTNINGLDVVNYDTCFYWLDHF